ncbi:nickel-dependent hydrogenase large subunit, partial [Nitrospirota bacterium]
GLYVASPLSRLNVSNGMSTPEANVNFQKMYESLGKRRIEGDRYEPIHHRLVTHWARLVELMYAAERMYDLARDPEITSPDVRVIPEGIVGEGIGSVEAPRGTLTHHYVTDENGILTQVNLIVGTTNNHAPMAMSIKRAAESFIKAGEVVEEGMLNRIEMAFRLYDPCLSCATHSIPGQMPMHVDIKRSDGSLLRRLSRG